MNTLVSNAGQGVLKFCNPVISEGSKTTDITINRPKKFCIPVISDGSKTPNYQTRFCTPAI